MNAETRTKNLFKLLGWKGGTIHDACKEIELEVDTFLYSSADFDDSGPCADFRQGYADAADIALYMHRHRGNVQYWFGCISAVQNDFIAPDQNGVSTHDQ